MRKQFFIPRYDCDNDINTRKERSEDDDGYNSFSNHPTGKHEKKWSRSALVKGPYNPGLKNGGGKTGCDRSE